MKAWLESHSVDEIRVANNARSGLRRMEVKIRGLKRRLEDERVKKRALSPFVQFYVERHAAGGYDGMPPIESTRSAGQEWKALRAEEREVRLVAPLASSVE